MDEIERFHFLIGVLACGLTALLLQISGFVKTPDIKPMTVSEQNFRNLRNLLINIASFSLMGFLVGPLLNALLRFLEGPRLENVYFSFLWVLVSVVVWLCWTSKKPQLHLPSPNSIFVTTNWIYTGKRELPKQKRSVDNMVKASGPNMVITNIFDVPRGEIQTEIRYFVEPINQLRCANTTGSAKLIGSYSVSVADVYFAGGDDETKRKNRVNELVPARMKTVIEKATQKESIEDVMDKAEEIFGKISDKFVQETSQLEEDLGVEILSMEVTDINESASYKEVIDAIGVNEKLRKQARDMVKESKGTLDYKTALQMVSGIASKAKYTIIHAQGLERSRALVGTDGEVTSIQPGEN